MKGKHPGNGLAEILFDNPKFGDHDKFFAQTLLHSVNLLIFTAISQFKNVEITKQSFDIPLRFRKAGREWCGGAGETH